MTRLTALTQNMTEGPVTDAMRDADVVLIQEGISKAALQRQMPRHEVFVSRRKPGQAIVWDPNLIDVRRGPLNRGFTLHHRSADAERFRTFDSPKRGTTWVKGTIRVNGMQVVLASDHLIHDWLDNGNQERANVIREVVLPKIRAQNRGWLRRWLVIRGGDFNTGGHQALDLPGLRRVTPDSGHDHIYVSPGIRAIGPSRRTPKTGVGGDWYHEGVAVDLRFDQPATEGAS